MLVCHQENLVVINNNTFAHALISWTECHKIRVFDILLAPEGNWLFFLQRSIVNRFHCLLLSKVCFLKKNRYNAHQGGMLSENEIDLKQAPFYNYENSPNWYNAVFCRGKTPPYIPFEIFKQTRCASRSKPHSQKDSQQHIYEFLLNKSNYLLKEKPRQINFLLFIPGTLCIMHYPNLNTISTAELYQSKEKRTFE